MNKICAVLIAVAGLALNACLSWAAEEYPNKPMQLICPYGAGGLTDIVARMVAEKMGRDLGTQIQVINKTGGGTSIGTAYVAAAKPDGYTLLINMTGGFVVTPLITPNLPYEMSDLKPIGKMVSAMYMVLANRDLPVKTLSELIAYARKNPNKLSYASPGVGTVNHLALEQMNSLNQLGMQHIPYTSELQVVTAILGHHVDAGAVTVPFSLKYVQGNQVRALGVLADKRDPLLPEVSTSAEQGVPDMVASIYNILFVPAKTPAPVVRQLEESLRRVLQDRETADSLRKMEITVDFLNSSDTQAFLDREVRKWAAVVKKANISNK